MSSCVPGHALLSAVVTRLEREGVVPSAHELGVLQRLGVTAQEIEAALARLPDRPDVRRAMIALRDGDDRAQ